MVLAAYSAIVMTITVNANPNTVGTNSHATDAEDPLPEPETHHQPGAQDDRGGHHDPDRIGHQSRQQARCPVHGQHPQSGQQAVCRVRA